MKALKATTLQSGQYTEKLRVVKINYKQLEDSSIVPVLVAREANVFPKKDELKKYSIKTHHLRYLWDQLEVENVVLH